MKYTHELTWKAVGEFLPVVEKLRKGSVHMNLPEWVKHAALEVFMLQASNNLEFKCDLNKGYASYILYKYMKEMKENGFVVFGDVNQYWS